MAEQQFLQVCFWHEQQENIGRRALELEQDGWVNFGAFLELKTEEASCQACRRTRLSGLKSELMCELHCNNK
jgi:hypothetical protein